MANQQQLDLLKQEVTTAWNTWREEHPDTPITLNGVDLSEANLGEVNLSQADLSGADLTRANLQGADIREALLVEAIWEGALITPEQMSQAQMGPDSL